MSDMRAKVLTGLGKLTTLLASGEHTPAQTVASLRRAANWIEATMAKDAQPALPGVSTTPDPNALVLRIFEHWRKTTGRTRADLTPGRTKAIRARLRQLNVPTIEAAVRGIAVSPFHRGEDPKSDGKRWDDLTDRWFASDERVLEWAARHREAHGSGTGEADFDKLAELEEDIARALASGEMGEHARLEAQYRKTKERVG